MQKILISQNPHWEKPYANLYPRRLLPRLLENLSIRQIQVLQGIRRSGKSSLFKLLINHLSQDVSPLSVFYINLDDPFFIQYAQQPEGLYEIIQLAEKLTQTPIQYLFLDEVQAISGWEKFVKSVYDSEQYKKIFITGSNSSLLNSEYATLLTGRYISTQVYPLSFNELLAINGIHTYMELHKQSSKVLKLVDDMLNYGSFVEVYDAPTALKREIVASYFETILLKDCVVNNQVRDIKGFKELSFYLTANLTALYSYSSLAKATGLSDSIVKDYIHALESSYLLNELRLFSYSLKEQMNNRKKPYLCDNSFMKLSYSFSNNHGKLLENLVFTELQKQEAEIYFYNKNTECDFIVKRNGKITAIQVCYELNEQNQKREINGLLNLPFDVDERIILTYNQNQEIDDIRVCAFWEYFFEKAGTSQ